MLIGFVMLTIVVILFWPSPRLTLVHSFPENFSLSLSPSISSSITSVFVFHLFCRLYQFHHAVVLCVRFIYNLFMYVYALVYAAPRFSSILDLRFFVPLFYFYFIYRLLSVVARFFLYILHFRSVLDSSMAI